MNNPWIMHVPVLSTIHMPGPYEPERLSHQGDFPVAFNNADDGMFIYIGREDDGLEYEGDNAWLAPISRWLDQHPKWDGRWVRFSGDCGDEVDELPKFNWE